MINDAQYIIMFDGVCNLCNNSVRFVIKRDKHEKFIFTSLQSEAGKKMLQQYDIPSAYFDSFILIKDDKYYTKSTAALKVLNELGGIWKFFNVFFFIPGSLRDMIYDVVARYRYRIFGKREDCMVPDIKIKDRFLV